MRRDKFMALAFFAFLVFGYLLCRRMAGMSVLSAGICGLVLSFLGMFVGMVLTHMHLYSKIHASEQRQKQIEKKRVEFEARMRELAERREALGNEVLLEFGKAVSQRVANKILAKHFDDLSNESKRASLFKSVDAIVEAEIVEAAMELANQDASEQR